MDAQLRTLLTDCLEHLEDLADRFNDGDAAPVNTYCEVCERAPIPPVAPCLACRIRKALKEVA